MPQMYPMMWTTLYSLFTLALILFLTLLYFTKSSKPLTKQPTTPQKSLYWQW